VLDEVLPSGCAIGHALRHKSFSGSIGNTGVAGNSASFDILVGVHRVPSVTPCALSLTAYEVLG